MFVFSKAYSSANADLTQYFYSCIFMSLPLLVRPAMGMVAVVVDGFTVVVVTLGVAVGGPENIEHIENIRCHLTSILCNVTLLY